jgi:hypothetical protein
MTTKAFGIVDVEIKAVDPDDDAGMFEAILSAPTLDRDGEIIDAKAFEPLPDHITIDIDHGMSVATTVGSGVPFYDGDLLKFRGSFSTIPRAQEVRTLVAEGHVRKMSVAFMNARTEVDPDDERPHIRSAELLNAAIVPIPSNREASILAAKAHAAALSDERLADETSTGTDPEPAAAPAAAAPAEVTVDPKALAALAEAEALLA